MNDTKTVLKATSPHIVSAKKWLIEVAFESGLIVAHHVVQATFKLSYRIPVALGNLRYKPLSKFCPNRQGGQILI